MKVFCLSLLCYLFYFSSATAQVSFAPTDTIAFYGGYLGTTDNAPIYPLDMDKDGDDDLIYTKSNKIYFKKNTGTGTFEEEKIIHTSFSHIYSVSNLADLNNDSHLDLAISTRDTIKILYGTGESFKEIRKTFEFFYSSKLILADFNKDGKTDLASSPVDKIVIREDVGMAFSAPKTFYTEANLYRYDLTDLNEDGQLTFSCLPIRMNSRFFWAALMVA